MWRNRPRDGTGRVASMFHSLRINAVREGASVIEIIFLQCAELWAGVTEKSVMTLDVTSH